jgi:hypothetical protein
MRSNDPNNLGQLAGSLTNTNWNPVMDMFKRKSKPSLADMNKPEWGWGVNNG